MTELYIFSQDDKLLTILSEGTGITSAPIRDELNQGSSFSFTTRSHAVYSQSYDINNNLTEVAGSFIGTLGSRTANKLNVSPSQFIKEENRVVFKDRLGDFREFVIKEIDDINGIEGPRTEATCIPSYLEELGNHIVVDKRFVNSTAQTALNAALEGTRFTGIVEVDLGEATTNFYYISSVDAVWETRDTWGGDIKDVVHLAADKSRVAKREMRLVQRLGEDKGLRFDIDNNIEQIERTVLSYPFTALYGRESSLRIEDEEGEETGGHTRYIGFEDVEWRKSWGDPVDKPLGQKWVGDPDALLKYGYKKDGQLLHLEDIFSNQDYEDPAELLWATWEHLKIAQHPEVNYRLAVDLLDKKAELGDTAIAIDREFARPIEIQTRIIAIEYDLLDIEDTAVVEMGQFLDLEDNRIDEVINTIENNRNKWDHPIIDDTNYPDIKPDTPTNFTAEGLFRVIQLSWDYDTASYIKHYEVYGSQVSDFVPESQHLLYRGQISGYAHEVGTGETWYYYVRAVNTRGTASNFSNRVSATTEQLDLPDLENIVPEFIEYSIYEGETAPDEDEYKFWLDVSSKPYVLKRWDGDGWIPLSPINADDIGAVDRQDYDQKVSEIVTDLADKADAEWVDGQLRSKLDLSEYTDFKEDYEETIVNIEERADGLAQSVAEVNVRIDNLDVRGTNFITHLPENWEQGARKLDDGTTYDETNAIRLTETYDIESNEDYVLTRYLDVEWIAIYLYDKNGNFKRAISAGYNDDDTWKSFTTASDEKRFTIVIYANGIDVLDLGVTIKAKLSLGTESSGWTPNINDTGQLVANVQEYVSEFEQTSQQIKADVSALEVDITDLGKDVSDINAELVVQADLISSKVDNTQYQTDINGIIEDIENHNTLIEQKADAIELSATRQELDVLSGEVESQRAELNVHADMIESKVDSESFDLLSKTVKSFGSHIEQTDKNILLQVSRTKAVEDGLEQANAQLEINAEEIESRVTKYKFNEDMDLVNSKISSVEQTAEGIMQSVHSFREEYDGFVESTSVAFNILSESVESRVEKRTYVTDMDNMTIRVDEAFTEIRQNADSITQKVSKNGVISAIEQSPEQVKISANRVDISGDLLVRNGKVYIQDGVVTNDMIAQDARIDFAKIANVEITDAMITNLSADKIDSGKLKGIEITSSDEDGEYIVNLKNGEIRTFTDGRQRFGVYGDGLVAYHWETEAEVATFRASHKDHEQFGADIGGYGDYFSIGRHVGGGTVRPQFELNWSGQYDRALLYGGAGVRDYGYIEL